MVPQRLWCELLRKLGYRMKNVVTVKVGQLVSNHGKHLETTRCRAQLGAKSSTLEDCHPSVSLTTIPQQGTRSTPNWSSYRVDWGHGRRSHIPNSTQRLRQLPPCDSEHSLCAMVYEPATSQPKTHFAASAWLAPAGNAMSTPLLTTRPISVPCGQATRSQRPPNPTRDGRLTRVRLIGRENHGKPHVTAH